MSGRDGALSLVYRGELLCFGFWLLLGCRLFISFFFFLVCFILFCFPNHPLLPFTNFCMTHTKTSYLMVAFQMGFQIRYHNNNNNTAT